MDRIKRQASDDFSKARAKEIFSRIKHFLHAGRNTLLSLEDVKKILRPENETYAGIRAVPVELIVGSEGRYRDFNKYFLPRSEHLRFRWERVDEARLSDIILPPIQLYEIGGVYFVRDGNHRVSVAMMQGVEMVDAEVISLSTEIQISPHMTIDELRAALLAYEKSIFYTKTNFEKLTGCGSLDFTMPGRYDVIFEHILVHKYYLNLPQSGEVPFSDALISWYNTVYLPIIAIITEENLCSHFPQRTPSDLYVWIVKHWDELKKQYGIHYALSEAVRDFNARYGKPPGSALSLIKALLSGILSKR